MSQIEKTEKIEIYSSGICHCSVCVPKDMDKETIEQKVNSENMTGIQSQWEISEENFASGASNPCPCEDNGTRQHYLMVC